MPLFPLRTNPPSGGFSLYKIEIPDDTDYSSIVFAALSFLADEEKYQDTPRTLPTPTDLQEQMAEVGAYIYNSVEPIMTAGQLVWSMVNPANASEDLLLADGSIINDYDYPELAEVLGSEWLVSPSPPGVIQFKLPNLIGAYASGVTSGNMQTRVGANSVTLTTGQMPSHSHSYTRPFVQPVTYTPGPGPATFVTAFNSSTSSVGSNQPHENRPLTQRLYPYIRTR